EFTLSSEVEAEYKPHALIPLAVSAPTITSHPCRTPTAADCARRRAFTLVEMLVVIVIISILLVLVIPAMNPRKDAIDFTKAGEAIKSAIEQARNYAQTKNTYVWLGFYEEDGSQDSTTPSTPGNGRLIVSTVASKDGTTIYIPGSTGTNPIDPTRLLQVSKLTKINNVHAPLFAPGSATGNTFDTRPKPDWNSFTIYNSSRFGELNAPPPNTAPTDGTIYSSKYPFQYPVGTPAPSAQYVFTRTIQFSPTGEARIFSTYDIRKVVEIGLVPTHGNSVPTPISGAGTSAVVFGGNVLSVQFSGIGSMVKIYKK
ncbi:MAG: type II secretion system protein, partial [Chthoniobacterales bacterium]|nr:type II secretion system protein [Chthoniobacterales bacterium]